MKFKFCIAGLLLALSHAQSHACPGGHEGQCPHKQTSAQKLGLKGERAEKVEQIEAQFKEQIAAVRAESKAKIKALKKEKKMALKAVLSEQELQQLAKKNQHHDHHHGHESHGKSHHDSHH